MAKVVPPKVRLAGPGLPGAEMYNYYQLISLLSGLYVKAMDRRDDEIFAGAWDTCSMSTLDQLGIAHQCWGKIQAQNGSTGLSPENSVLIKKTLTLVKRLVTIDDHLTEWVAVSRWSRIFLHIEKMLKKLGGEIARQNPFLADQLAMMTNAYDSRCALLEQILAKSLNEEQAINLNYALPVAL